MMDSDQLRVEEIRIENVFGVRELAFDPDGVSVIKGDNDTGKTSVLRAISLLLGGGHDPEALHKDAESGRVEFELDDGTKVYSSLTQNHTYHRVETYGDAFDGEMSSRDILEAIQDEISVNPIQILQARPQDRGQILLEAMPMTLDQDSFHGALRPLDGDWPGFPFNAEQLHSDHALEVLGDKSSGAIGTLYEQRQELHGAKRDKEGTVNDLEDAVGEHDDPETLKDTRDRVIVEQREIERQKEGAIEQVNEWEKEEIERIRSEAKEKRDDLRETYQPQTTELEKRRERLNEKIEQAERAQQTVETLETRKAELDELEDRYDRLTEAIENLRDLRTDFAEDLPEGVQIGDEGEIYSGDGIPFENWNEERQVRFGAKIAEMRRGKLGLIPIDGIEKLVGDQREAFLGWARESDAQFILTEAVPDQELTVTHA